ncbi:hypothetical protein D3C72_1343960 [compost metagenome]
MGAPKVSVTRCRAIASRNPRGAYSRRKTSVPPISSVPKVQLLSGAACQIGMAMSIRSLCVIDRAAAQTSAVVKTARWLCRHPLGWPVVPEV